MRAFVLCFLVTLATQAQDLQHLNDGHVVERLQSITVSTKAGAPFRAMVVTDWTRTLADGTRVTLKNRRLVARDSTGRVFQERRYLSPDGDIQQTPISELDYYDPVRKEVSVCYPLRKICEVRTYLPTESAVETCKPVTMPQISITCEALGRSQTDNVETLGLRQITTVTGGPMGLKVPEPTIKEFWFSSRLDLNLIVKRFDPRGGAQNFIFQDLSLNEPDPSLFTPPQGYRTARTVVQ